MTTELGHMFEQVGILFPVYILPKTQKRRRLMVIGVVDKAKTTDDDAGIGKWKTKRTVGLKRGYTKLQSK